MTIVFKKWGNSLATRIPHAVVKSIDLHLDQEVDIEAFDGRIIITPIKKRKEYKLKDLLDQCKPEAINLTEEDQEWLNAVPVGKEAW